MLKTEAWSHDRFHLIDRFSDNTDYKTSTESERAVFQNNLLKEELTLGAMATNSALLKSRIWLIDLFLRYQGLFLT